MSNKYWPNADRLATWTVSAGAVALLLVACGGGGGGTAVTPTPEPSPEAALSISGTAATGAAISNRPVSVKCAKGANTVTTNAAGRYTVAVAGGTLPCLVKVTAADSSTLHSVVTGAGNTAVANITPVTQLIVANLSGRDPAAFFTVFDASTAASVDSAKVGAAQTAVVATLRTAGVDMSALGDLLTSNLIPAAPGNAGNAYDVALDALKAALENAILKLEDLVKEIIAKSPNVPETTASLTAGSTTGASTVDASGVPSLPAALLLKAQAAHCSALRSGTYRFVAPVPGATLASETGTSSINARTLTVTESNATTWQLTAVANKPCRFTGPNGDEFVVSQAGVIVGRVTKDGGTTFRPVVAFPAQTHTLADLTGTWNQLGLLMTGTAGVFAALTSTATLNDTGEYVGPVKACSNIVTWGLSGADCSNVTASLKFVANADGGFDQVRIVDNTVLARLFLYQSGGGELMGVIVGGAGSLFFMTKERTLVLPPVGRVTTNAGFGVDASMLVPGGSGNGNQQTIVSLNSTAGSYLRTSKTIGGTDDHPQTLTINGPRNGYATRTAATGVSTNSGGTVNVSEFTALGMRGLGLAAVVIPANKSFVLSVDLP